MFKKALLASAAVMAAGVASAEVTGNFAVVSDYIFRGTNYSAGPAVQGGLDYSHDSGLYAGIWASTANNSAEGVSGGTEVDYYVGYGMGLSDGLSLDLGLIHYTADGDKGGSASGDDTINEVYVGVAGESWSATAYYGDPDDGGVDEEYLYVDLGYSMSTGETTSVDLHVGFNEPSASGDPSSTDYSVTYNVGDFNMGVTLLDTENAADNRPELFIGWGTEFDVK